MRRWLWSAARAVAALAASSGAASAQDDASSASFVELVTERSAVFAGEDLTATLRFGFDTRFLRENVVAVLRQRLDVPAQLETGGSHSLGGPSPRDADGGASVVLDGRVVLAARASPRIQNGREFTVFEIGIPFVAERIGDHEVPSPRLRFAWATRFREDFFGERAPEDRRDATVTGSPLRLRVEALPSEGRPADFGGAIGRFTVTADVVRRDVPAGETLRLVLRITGDGNRERFTAPRLDGLLGFRVLGSIDEPGTAAREITYDLAPAVGGITAVPPIRFPYFDPTPPGAYRTAITAAIPIVVSGEPTVVAPDEAPADRAVKASDRFVDELPAARPPSSRNVATPAALIALALPWCVALAFVAWSRARRAALADRDGRRARRAVSEFRAARPPDVDALAHAFTRYLAARLRCPAAAVVAPELASRLVAVGCGNDVASRAAGALHALVAARYGREPAPFDHAALLAVVDEVEVGFRRAEDAA
ncbi:MAG: BatD family protein [Planctomycetes bacterium]|nr:BatD family protein [Planctomycetota bacterium]